MTSKLLAIVLLILLIVALAGCATTPLRAWEPYPWNEPEFLVINLPQVTVQKVCVGDAWLPPGWSILACVQEIGPMRRGQGCVIHIARDIDVVLYNKILRHEKAHCRGWEHGQPVPEGDYG
jgi:hypothetical protein